MKKKHFEKIIFLLIPVLVISLILLYSLIEKNKKMIVGNEESNETSFEKTDSQDSSDPIPLDQVIEEFKEDLNGEDETVNPEDFSDYQEEYIVEVQEDEVVDIH